ncbi:succinate dehydrogenase cytochrome b subunit [Dysgonomonas sp. 25]|uniref:succinate dehydrogenase cytochrome b subunit n=1 Tax=Dysgonomonas sp. 25 TaxID=2302933 RepID=UPI0013D4A7C2|nr:succinate dehydrogenase cytochrome b subunit [Dysgonomonas sp. 25]NDV69652.1 succinate dehydrogenase/fumarate reductase cytochrome b subunit [Dysgonomonas sp. 25]
MSCLFTSSIGKKLIMSISGVVLVLFLLFHATMNVIAIFSEEMYNDICALLGANWYAVLGTAALGAIVAIHFIYAFVLTIQNRKARGKDRYAVTKKPKPVEWASQNMLVLGIIVIGFLGLHFSHFWYKMMFTELMGHHTVNLGGEVVSPQDGAAFIKYYFSHLWIVVAYLVWYVALWFHLSHGFWSALQTIGWNGKTWFNRWKVISNILATAICLAFAAVTIFFYLKSIYCLC